MKGSRYLTNLHTNRSQDSDGIKEHQRPSRNDKIEEGGEKIQSPTMARFSKNNAYL
jgi:hypothetical protein